MGMYTEFIFGCELSKDTPRVCIEALDKSINAAKKTSDNFIKQTLPDKVIDDFIDEYDFDRLFHSSSYYFGAANPIHKFYWDPISKSYHISTRADLKDYNDQIQKFIEYITPFVTHGSGYDHRIFAYVQYEEDEFPTLYGIDGVYHVLDPELEKKVTESNEKRWELLEKLFEELCPDYELTDSELKSHNIDPEKLTYEQGWELMIEHLINKYKKYVNKSTCHS